MAHEYLTRIAKSMLMYAYIDLRGRELIVTLLCESKKIVCNVDRKTSVRRVRTRVQD